MYQIIYIFHRSTSYNIILLHIMRKLFDIRVYEWNAYHWISDSSVQSEATKLAKKRNERWIKICNKSMFVIRTESFWYLKISPYQVLFIWRLFPQSIKHDTLFHKFATMYITDRSLLDAKKFSFFHFYLLSTVHCPLSIVCTIIIVQHPWWQPMVLIVFVFFTLYIPEAQSVYIFVGIALLLSYAL